MLTATPRRDPGSMMPDWRTRYLPEGSGPQPPLKAIFVPKPAEPMPQLSLGIMFSIRPMTYEDCDAGSRQPCPSALKNFTAARGAHSVWPKVVTAPGGGGAVATIVCASPLRRRRPPDVRTGADQSSPGLLEIAEEVKDRLVVGGCDRRLCPLPLLAGQTGGTAGAEQRHKHRHLRRAPPVCRRVAAERLGTAGAERCDGDLHTPGK